METNHNALFYHGPVCHIINLFYASISYLYIPFLLVIKTTRGFNFPEPFTSEQKQSRKEVSNVPREQGVGLGEGKGIWRGREWGQRFLVKTKRVLVENMAAKEMMIVFVLFFIISPSLSEKVLSLTDVDFDDRVFGSSTHFIMFYGPW